jgi:ribonuclease J
VIDQLENTNPNDTIKLSERIRSVLRRFFRDVLGRDPVVVPIVREV